MKAIAALALAVPLLISAAAEADPASLSYRSERLHYAISYPSSWAPFHVARADFALMAADRNAFVSTSVANGTVTAKDQAHTVTYSFSAFGRAMTKPLIQPVQVQGGTGTLGTATIRSGADTLSTVYVFLATYRLRNYTVIGIVRNAHAKSAQTDQAALLTMIRSTTFFS